MSAAVFTEHTRNRKFKQIAWTQAMPPCQAHLIIAGQTVCTAPGEYDTPLRAAGGTWGDLCETHMLELVGEGTQVGFHRIAS